MILFRENYFIIKKYLYFLTISLNFIDAEVIFSFFIYIMIVLGILINFREKPKGIYGIRGIRYSLFRQSIKISRSQLGGGIALMRPQTTLREVPESSSEFSVVDDDVLVIVCHCGWKDDGELPEGMRLKCAKFQLRQGKNRWWSRIIASSLKAAPTLALAERSGRERPRHFIRRVEEMPDIRMRAPQWTVARIKNINLRALSPGRQSLADRSFRKTQQTLAECIATDEVRGIRVCLTGARVTAQLGRVTFGSNFRSRDSASCRRKSIFRSEMNEFTSTKLNRQNFERAIAQNDSILC